MAAVQVLDSDSERQHWQRVMLRALLDEHSDPQLVAACAAGLRGGAGTAACCVQCAAARGSFLVNLD